jgi:hypothetical protein
VTQQELYEVVTGMLQLIVRTLDGLSEEQALVIREDIRVLGVTLKYALQQQDQGKLERLYEEVVWLGQDVGQTAFAR